LIKCWQARRFKPLSADSVSSSPQDARSFPSLSTTQRQEIIRSTARLMLLLGGWVTLLLFAASSSAAQRPWSTRYLIGLLIIIPALLWPIVDGLKFVFRRSHPSRRSRL